MLCARRCDRAEFGMLPKDIAKKFTGVAGLNVCSTALNLGTTILVVRWCGSSSYANFVVDLAVVSLLLLLLEIVPSNLSVFRLQDDRGWRKVVQWHLVIVAAIVVAVIYALKDAKWMFQAYTPWIALYALSQIFKRFLDLMLQSSGRLNEFMMIEVASSSLRIIFLTSGYFFGLEGAALIWAPLACSVVFVQMFWVLMKESELVAADVVTFPVLGESSYGDLFRSFLPYYPGIALKRIKDNLLPLVGNLVLSSKETLGMFMLAYRGLVFASGQLRIFEALLYHRGTLRNIDGLSVKAKALIAATAQVVALIASVVLLLLSDEPIKPYGAAVMLSFLVWPMTFYVIERANAFSEFNAWRVNVGMMVYMAVMLFGAFFLRIGAFSGLYAFIAIFLIAEIAQYCIVRQMRCEVK